MKIFLTCSYTVPVLDYSRSATVQVLKVRLTRESWTRNPKRGRINDCSHGLSKVPHCRKEAAQGNIPRFALTAALFSSGGRVRIRVSADGSRPVGPSASTPVSCPPYQSLLPVLAPDTTPTISSKKVLPLRRSVNSNNRWSKRILISKCRRGRGVEAARAAVV